MRWPVNPSTDEGRVKWNTAVKFLIPTKFDISRAIELYKTHQVFLYAYRNLYNFILRIFVNMKNLIIFGSIILI